MSGKFLIHSTVEPTFLVVFIKLKWLLKFLMLMNNPTWTLSGVQFQSSSFCVCRLSPFFIHIHLWPTPSLSSFISLLKYYLSRTFSNHPAQKVSSLIPDSLFLICSSFIECHCWVNVYSSVKVKILNCQG